jgi:hypothetical protein
MFEQALDDHVGCRRSGCFSPKPRTRPPERTDARRPERVARCRTKVLVRLRAGAAHGVRHVVGAHLTVNAAFRRTSHWVR